MEVVWNGTMARGELREAEPPPPLLRSRPIRPLVLDLLAEQDLTMPELAAIIGVSQGRVNGTIYTLKSQGLVVYGSRSERTHQGRIARSYHRV